MKNVICFKCRSEFRMSQDGGCEACRERLAEQETFYSGAVLFMDAPHPHQPEPIMFGFFDEATDEEKESA